MTSEQPGAQTGQEHAFRSGFATLVGRPNAGKSTLVNSLVGTKVVITSSRPQTTRRAVRGIVDRPDAQLVLVDTPGLHRPRTLLGERLNDTVRETWTGVDAVVLCIAADQTVGTGDRFIAAELAGLRRLPVLAVVTKVDLVGSDVVAERLAEVAELGREVDLDWAEVVPVSALRGDGVGLLADLLVATLPEGPPLYPPGSVTDATDEDRVADLIREAALEGVRDELPHSIAVVVDEIAERDGRPPDRPLIDVHAVMYVERDSQKAIVIGKGGARLKQVGATSRAAIERLLGSPVYLDLRVKVAKDWQRDPKLLNRLGF